jgi:hypothetical protein
VPFVAKGPPVELWPGVSIRFSKITQDGDSYMYAPDISATNHPLFDGQIQPGGLPKQVIANRFWIDASGKPLTDQPPMMGRFITESENGGFGQFGAPARPAALRFVIARGIHERQIPIALKQVALPHFGAFPNEPQGGEK